MIRKIKNILRPLYKLYRYKLRDFKSKYLYQYFPKKPEVINFLANDICNSKCVMCNIWEQKQEHEISPEELEIVLSDGLFKHIKHVGVTGGEPTLRSDLPELYRVICKSLPSLKAVSIITNAIKEKEVIERIEKVHEVCKEYGKDFSVMVSLDGYGEVHDKNRRRPGNFESAIQVIEHIRSQTEIPLAIGCTLTKDNLWGADELLDYLKEHNIYGRFRIAEYINRLYNDNLKDSIRSFTPIESYNLACFFQRLQLEFESNPSYKRTYANIQHMLMGGSRQIGCPYHTDGVVLDSRGNVQYCAPKSKVLGSAIKDSAQRLFKGNLKERKRIMKENCSDCIHDYHAPITAKEQIDIYKEAFYKRLLSIPHSHKSLKLGVLFNSPSFKKSTNQVFITGWYGTETVGDKAILGAILDYYDAYYEGKVSFIISAFHPFITIQTLRELNREATVVHVYSYDFIASARTSDITVMGGGPLMDMESLSVPLAAFRLANKAKKKTVIFGCGLGPLHKKKYLDVVVELLNTATEIKLRDSNSLKWAIELSNRNDIEMYGDPAYHYVKKFKQESKPIKEKKLSCFLRDWSKEYIGELPEDDFEKIKADYEQKLAKSIKDFCKKYDLIPSFYCMHTFCVGGDDRSFYRRFTKTYFQDMEYYVEETPSSVEQIVNAMITSEHNLCMRFHSVLFANTLETDFFAIDYTNGGKIKGYLGDHNKSDKKLSLIEFSRKEYVNLEEYFTVRKNEYI